MSLGRRATLDRFEDRTRTRLGLAPRSEAPRTGAPAAVDRALRKNTEAASSRKGYDLDAQAIAKVLVRHYGDEAEAVLKRAVEWLPAAQRTKR